MPNTAVPPQKELVLQIDARQKRTPDVGSIHEVGLAQTRELATAAHQLHRNGIDPIVARDRQRQDLRSEPAVTFRGAFETFFATKSQSLENSKHKQHTNRALKIKSPTIGLHAGRLPM